MAVSELNLDDYSVYSNLSDEELLQIAVERSLSEKHPQKDAGPSSAAPVPAVPAAPQRPDLSRRRYQNPPSQPPRNLPNPNPNSANPPTSLARIFFNEVKRELSPLQLIMKNGDAEALMDLVERKSGSLTEPNKEGWIALHEAAFYGQLQCVRILVRADPSSVNKCTLDNETPLMLAACQGKAPCVEFFLRNGANPNTANKSRETPLFAACEHPNKDIVEMLLKSGAQVNRCCSQGGSPLHEACRHGDLEICKMLLDAGADLNIKNIYSIRPFFTAAQHGFVEVLGLLAHRGADINAQAGDGASPLYEACKNGHVSAVQKLISLKADANRMTRSSRLPLHIAAKNNHIRIVSMLIPVTSKTKVKSCGISPLHIAAEQDRDEIMEMLIESGFDVNAKLSDEHARMYEDRRTTALYSSVYNGNLEAVEMLLEAGANPNLDIFNPLLIAVRLGWMEMAELLVRYGADVNAQMSTQPSTFPSAILLSMEFLPMLKLLLDNGCNARPCFDCMYGQKPHPAVAPPRRPMEEMRRTGNVPPQRCIQYCDAVSSPSLCRISGPVISLLLDYVCHVRLCSRLLEILESRSDWAPIKLKALPPHPLMQLCRLKIRHLLGAHRLRLLQALPLPPRLIRFLLYDIRHSIS